MPVGLPPQITSINPDTASAGTGSPGDDYGAKILVLMAHHQVDFWAGEHDACRSNVISWSDTKIVCTVPYGAQRRCEMDGV